MAGDSDNRVWGIIRQGSGGVKNLFAVSPHPAFGHFLERWAATAGEGLWLLLHHKGERVRFSLLPLWEKVPVRADVGEAADFAST